MTSLGSQLKTVENHPLQWTWLLASYLAPRSTRRASWLGCLTGLPGIWRQGRKGRRSVSLPALTVPMVPQPWDSRDHLSMAISVFFSFTSSLRRVPIQFLIMILSGKSLVSCSLKNGFWVFGGGGKKGPLYPHCLRLGFPEVDLEMRIL